jgi:hypothetical protein
MSTANGFLSVIQKILASPIGQEVEADLLQFVVAPFAMGQSLHLKTAAQEAVPGLIATAISALEPAPTPATEEATPTE